MEKTDGLKRENEIERMIKEAIKIKGQSETDAMYQFEHLNLRQLFFDTGTNFINELINKKNDFVYFIYVNQCKIMNQLPKYSKEQFILSAHSNIKNQIVLELVLPEPYRPSLCYEIYMVVDGEGKAVSYYTIEKEVGNNSPVLCEWGRSGIHYNYGSKRIKDSNCGALVQEFDLNKANSFVELLEQTNSTAARKKYNVFESDVSKKQIEELDKNQAIERNISERINRILFCRNCGTKLSDDEIFCHKCGIKI